MCIFYPQEATMNDVNTVTIIRNTVRFSNEIYKLE